MTVFDLICARRNVCSGIAAILLFTLFYGYGRFSGARWFRLNSGKDGSIFLRTQSQPSSNRTRPRAVIHIGPHKTATSSIQATLQQSSTRKLLRKDDYAYFHRHDKHNPVPVDVIQDYKHDDGLPYDEKIWEPWKRYMKKLLKSKKNYLASDEAFARSIYSMERLRPIEQGLSGFDIRVVATYRRYTEWIWSFYEEAYKYMYKPVPPFTEFFADLVEREASMTHTFYPLQMFIWKNLTEDFFVFNYHEHTRENFVSDFICESIVGANHTCRALQEESLHKEGSVNVSPSKNRFEASRIAYMAYEKDLVYVEVYDDDFCEHRKSFDSLITTISDFMDSREDLPLPLVCPSKDQLDTIFERAVMLEKAAVPDFHESKGMILLQENFATAVAENSYCSVDVEKALESSVWQDFFKQMS